ncbi:MAG: hypothetical protein Q9197_002988 [Variospora fuerteventurae]
MSSLSSRPTMTFPPLHLILDWDGTLTTSSTLPTIAQIGYARNASHPLPSWHTISEAYMSDLRAHTSTYSPPASERNTIAQELQWLESLRDVERKSTERVEAAGIFRNVGREDVRHAAEQAMKEGKVVLRDGWIDLVAWVLKDGGEVGVVSVGWSAEFIRWCLKTGLEASKEEGKEGVKVEDIDVRANEVLDWEDGKLRRYFEEEGRGGEGGIWTARDKRKVVDEMAVKEGDGKKRVVVYVGDSVTDLECLLSANVGFCVRDEVESDEQIELKQSLGRLGVGCSHFDIMTPANLSDFVRRGGSADGSSVWWDCGFPSLSRSAVVQVTGHDRTFGSDMYLGLPHNMYMIPKMGYLHKHHPEPSLMLARFSTVIRNARCMEKGYKIDIMESNLEQIST